MSGIAYLDVKRWLQYSSLNWNTSSIASGGIPLANRYISVASIWIFVTCLKIVISEEASDIKSFDPESSITLNRLKRYDALSPLHHTSIQVR